MPGPGSPLGGRSKLWCAQSPSTYLPGEPLWPGTDSVTGSSLTFSASPRFSPAVQLGVGTKDPHSVYTPSSGAFGEAERRSSAF